MPATSLYAVRPNVGRVSARVTRFTEFLGDWLAMPAR